VVPGEGHVLPPPAVLLDVYRWLEQDLKRRQADSRRHGFSADGSPSRLVLASRAVRQSKEELAEPDRTYRAVARLRWVKDRFGSTEAGPSAEELLEQVRKDPMLSARLAAQTRAASGRLLTARAAALEKAGQLSEARRDWEEVQRLADTPAAMKRALAELRRLAGLMARAPYLGLTLAGDTTVVRTVVPDGPADLAGLRVGDRLEKVGGVKVADPAAVRRQVRRSKPGDDLALVVARKERLLPVVVKVGAVP
jgi:hypothetical protein